MSGMMKSTSRHFTQRPGSSGFAGVRQLKSGSFEAYINVQGKRTTSYHAFAEAAALWYDAKAREGGRPEKGLNFPRGGQPSAADLAAARSREEAPSCHAFKHRRASSPAVSSSSEDEPDGYEASAGEREAGAVAEEEPALDAAVAEFGSESLPRLPRLRALLQAAEQRAAARDARRASADAAVNAADSRLLALEAMDVREAAASARLRQMLTVAERVEARLALLRAAAEAAREAAAAEAKAAALQARAAQLAAALSDGSESETEPMEA